MDEGLADLLHRVVALLGEHARERMPESGGLTYSQLRLLGTIEDREPMTQHQLAESLSVSDPAISRALRPLEGLVRTEPDPCPRAVSDLALLCIGVALLLLAGCTAGSPSNRSVPSASSSRDQSASTTDPTASSPCADTAMKALVSTFVTAFNAGDNALLESLWASTAQGFRWYNVGPPRAPSHPGSRHDLVDYFSSRHLEHERLRLTSITYNGTNGQGYGNFQFTLTRTADDIGSLTFTGKGAAFCRPGPGQLFVWAMTSLVQERRARARS
jgi:MarR family